MIEIIIKLIVLCLCVGVLGIIIRMWLKEIIYEAIIKAYKEITLKAAHDD
jgi:hypothetical protein